MYQDFFATRPLRPPIKQPRSFLRIGQIIISLWSPFLEEEEREQGTEAIYTYLYVWPRGAFNDTDRRHQGRSIGLAVERIQLLRVDRPAPLVWEDYRPPSQ